MDDDSAGVSVSFVPGPLVGGVGWGGVGWGGRYDWQEGGAFDTPSSGCISE